MKPMKRSFTQFQKCELCQIHHRQKHRHVYSTQHQQNVHRCLSKFKKKIESALVSYKKPVITSVLSISDQTTDRHKNEEVNRLLMCSRIGIPLADEAVLRLDNENERKSEIRAPFWCYFCQKELPRDDVMNDVIVKNGLFWQHLQSSEHGEKRDLFWKQHKVDTYHKFKKEQFSITEECLTNFKKAVETSLAEFIHKREMKMRKEAERIQRLEQGRASIRQQQQTMLEAKTRRMNERQLQGQPYNQTNSRMPLSRVRTVAAEARGLAIIKIKDFDEKLGNIHTGAVPPWLSQDGDKDGDKDGNSEKERVTLTVGPTKEDHEKQLAAIRRGKLPPNRVGAKERLMEMNKGSDWLPSFGRVWSKKPRTQVRKTFMSNLADSSTSTVTMHSQFSNPRKTDPDRDTDERELHYPSDAFMPPGSVTHEYNANDNQLHDNSSFKSCHKSAYAGHFSNATFAGAQSELPQTVPYGYVKKKTHEERCSSLGRIPIADTLLE